MKKFLFEKDLMVVLGDTDAGGRIYFARPAHWFHSLWEEYFDFKGSPISKMLNGQFHLPIVNYEIQFKAPLRAGDKVRVALAFVEVSQRSFTANYEAVDPIDVEKVFIVGKITHVTVDTESGKPIPLPQKIKDILA